MKRHFTRFKRFDLAAIAGRSIKPETGIKKILVRLRARAVTLEVSRVADIRATSAMHQSS